MSPLRRAHGDVWGWSKWDSLLKTFVSAYLPYLTRKFRLAYAEITLVFASLFGPNGPKLKLYETDESDADPACHFLLPLPRLDSKGVRVTVEA